MGGTRAVLLAGTTIVLACVSTVARAQTEDVPPATTQENSTTASAQPPKAAATDRRSYDADYFSAYAPSNALQMVQRVPGFALEETDSETRGFGGTAGNLVINGQRPSSKTDGLSTILARIPANRVVRIEVGPGDLFGAEYSGKAQVANIVMSADAGTSGSVEIGSRRDFSGGLRPFGSASIISKSGRSTFNASFDFRNAYTSEEGPDRITRLSDGVETEFREKFNHIKEPYGALSASWAWDGGENKTAHLNGRFSMTKLSLTQSNLVFPLVGPDRNDRLTQRYDRNDWEIGGDVTRPFAGGGLKLIGLVTRRYRDFRDASYNRLTDLTQTGGFTQRLVDSYGESLVRLVWNRSNLHGWTVESGVEGVLNKLDSDVALALLGPDGVVTPIDLPVDQAVVKELRGETFINVGRPLSKALRLDLGLTYEHSRITVSGDATSERTLGFLKPKLVLDWRPTGSKWHVQLTAQRTVAQLQFTDFISSAELSNDRVNGGNAELLPQRAWEITATIERPILGDGAFRTEIGYRKISKLQDRVPTPEGFDAPGNLGTGTVWILRNRLDLPLKSIGIKGGRLTLYSSHAKTRVRDPYTLEYREFSNSSPWYGEANFRQDLGKWAWGLNAYFNTEFTAFRRNELDTGIPSKIYMDGFVEWRPDSKTTVTLTIDNLLNSAAGRARSFFDPDRRTPEPYAYELRERNKHVVPILTLKRTFG